MPQPIEDIVNVREELGDLLWYIALALRSIDSDFEEVFAVNIAKLRARFPGKFTEDAAVERDLTAERVVLEAWRLAPKSRENEDLVWPESILRAWNPKMPRSSASPISGHTVAQVDLDNPASECLRLMRHELECARRSAAALGSVGDITLCAIDAAIRYEAKSRELHVNVSPIVSGAV